MFDIDRHLEQLPIADLTAVARQPVAASSKAQLRIARRVSKRRFARLEARKAAARVLAPLPKRHESIHVVADGSFSGWSVAEAILDLLDEPVRELTIATLGFNRENAESLCKQLDSRRVKRVLLMASDYFRSSDRTIFADIRQELESRGQRVAVTRSHAKLLLFRTKSHSIVVETSANLRSSQNYEQITIANDRRLLTFHRRWIEKLCQPPA